MVAVEAAAYAQEGAVAMLHQQMAATAVQGDLD
jgi:hypothetical protein